jgi:hypothetical protein
MTNKLSACAVNKDTQDEITINTSSQARSQYILLYWIAYQWHKDENHSRPIQKSASRWMHNFLKDHTKNTGTMIKMKILKIKVFQMVDVTT